MNKNIIILGRGSSLERIPELEEVDNIEYVILVNTFWDSPQTETPYYKNTIIHNILSKKKIILFFNPMCDLNKFNIFCQKYNIIDIYITLFSKEIRIGKDFIKNIIIEKGDIYPYNSIKLLPDELIPIYLYKKQHFKRIGCLGLSILLATISLKYKNIYIFGLDFYEKDYLFQQNHNYSIEKQDSDLQKKDFLKFFQYMKKINFFLYSLADVKKYMKNNNINISNLKVL